MDKKREIELVTECQQGNRKALDTLVRHFEKPVYNAAFRMLGNVDEAADVTQTVFMKLFESIDRFDPNYRLFSWIYRIAINEAITQVNRRRRLEPIGELPCQDEDASEESAAAAQLSKGIQVVLMELHESHRTMIVLRYFNECSYQQMAEILGIPEKTVKSRLFSARQQLKHCLEQHGILHP